MALRRRIIVTLNLPDHVPDLIKRGRAIVQAMSANPTLAGAAPSLASVTSEIDALEAAELTAESRAPGAVEVREAKRSDVAANLHQLKAFIQGVANADPASAEALILGAGMEVKKSPSHKKDDFEARHGDNSGDVLLIARAVSARASYQWRWSADQETWTTLPTTLSPGRRSRA